MKELSNDRFFIKWKPNHEKGILSYHKRNTMPIIMIIIITNAFFRIIYPMKTEAFKTSIYGSAFSVLIIIVTNVLKWISSEKRYKYIEEVREETMQ